MIRKGCLIILISVFNGASGADAPVNQYAKWKNGPPHNIKNLDFWGSLSDPDFRFWVIRNCQRVDQPKVGAGVIELGIV